MNNYEILRSYSKGDLRRLAKGKISEIVGLDADKILKDLSRVLGNYESIKRNVEFRVPPTETILEVLLEAEDHMVLVDDLKPTVRDRIRRYGEESKAVDLQDKSKGYRLYATMLVAAWDFGDDIVPSEANLLRVLRRELEISRRDHLLIMAHPEVGRLTFDPAAYEEELSYLSGEGVVLVRSDGENHYFILSDETAESLLQLWGFEMERSQYARLLECLSKPQLVRPLKTAGLRISGANTELAVRIAEAEISPSTVLAELPVTELAALLGKLGLPKSGKKEDRILRAIDYFKSDTDIVEPTVEAPPVEMPPEASLLSEETLTDVLWQLGGGQLAGVLGSLGLRRSGAKAEIVERLVRSPYNSRTILTALSLEDLRTLVAKIGLKRSGNKPDLVESVIAYYQTQEVEESSVTTKDLLDIYEEISHQDRRAYPAATMPNELSITRMGLDFERATRYIFKNMLNLDTRVQRAGHEEPDGILADDEGCCFCYECKTVLCPPYALPIRHRLQIRNYVSAMAASRRADRFGGYLIISHSFIDTIDQKLAEIRPALEIPIGVVAAQDLLSFARKWQLDRPIDTYPIGRAMKNGRITAKDLDRAAR